MWRMAVVKTAVLKTLERDSTKVDVYLCEERESWHGADRESAQQRLKDAGYLLAGTYRAVEGTVQTWVSE